MKSKIILLIVVLYISIFFHEIGHLLTYRYNGLDIDEVSVGVIGEVCLTIFTDEEGTQYKIGPLPLWGQTVEKDPERWSKLDLAQKSEILLAGISFNALIVLFLTPGYFFLRGAWRKQGKDFLSSILGKAFKISITLNYLLFLYNLLPLLLFCDGGQLLYFVLSQWFGKDVTPWIVSALGIVLFYMLMFSKSFKVIFEKTFLKIYGWPGWL